MIGKYFTIPAETELFCIELQAVIKFNEDIIVEITHSCVPNIDDFFCKRKQLLFNLPGYVPTLIDHRGNFPINISKLTTEYLVPAPNIFIDYSFIKTK